MSSRFRDSGFYRKIRPWIRALTNPHLLISLALAWFLTNGWAYCALGAGAYFDIGWLRRIGTLYIGLLWLPGTPEKLVTLALAMLLLRVFFPDDTRTLAAVRRKRMQLAERVRIRYASFRPRLRKR